jgi:hypothetical protein
MNPARKQREKDRKYELDENVRCYFKKLKVESRDCLMFMNDLYGSRSVE